MAEQGFTLTSPSFREGADISSKHTCDGENRSPRLEWMHPPEGTRSYALIVDDPDAPRGTFTHWVHFNIPGELRELAEGQSAGADGKNDFQQVGYGGPCPPPNHDAHRYFFKLFALDIPKLDLEAGARREELERAIEGHVLDQTQLMGLYRRTTGRP